ncbi:MAG: hypothetical protein IKA90_00545 [Clostridia bacterium]|nr:hypothetical protein [Clostridia bacterium]
MQKQKLTTYKNQNGIDFVSALNQEQLADLVAMYVCAMHPNYRMLPSSVFYGDEMEMTCFDFVKKNSLPIGCIVTTDKDFDYNLIESDDYLQAYAFCGCWDENCPQPGEKTVVEQINEKLFSTNQRAICRADLFNFAKQNYGNGLLKFIDDNFVF